MTPLRTALLTSVLMSTCLQPALAVLPNQGFPPASEQTGAASSSSRDEILALTLAWYMASASDLWQSSLPGSNISLPPQRDPHLKTLITHLLLAYFPSAPVTWEQFVAVFSTADFAQQAAMQNTLTAVVKYIQQIKETTSESELQSIAQSINELLQETMPSAHASPGIHPTAAQGTTQTTTPTRASKASKTTTTEPSAPKEVRRLSPVELGLEVQLSKLRGIYTSTEQLPEESKSNLRKRLTEAFLWKIISQVQTQGLTTNTYNEANLLPQELLDRLMNYLRALIESQRHDTIPQAIQHIAAIVNAFNAQSQTSSTTQVTSLGTVATTTSTHTSPTATTAAVASPTLPTPAPGATPQGNPFAALFQNRRPNTESK